MDKEWLLKLENFKKEALANITEAQSTLDKGDTNLREIIEANIQANRET